MWLEQQHVFIRLQPTLYARDTCSQWWHSAADRQPALTLSQAAPEKGKQRHMRAWAIRLCSASAHQRPHESYLPKVWPIVQRGWEGWRRLRHV